MSTARKPQAKPTPWCLYLDDERFPKTDRDWVIVRNYEQFVAAVEERGFPAVVSFDHDLGEDERGSETPSGNTCAKWLTALGRKLGINPHDVEWNVHSANMSGQRNIRDEMIGWEQDWDLPEDRVKFEGSLEDYFASLDENQDENRDEDHGSEEE